MTFPFNLSVKADYDCWNERCCNQQLDPIEQTPHQIEDLVVKGPGRLNGEESIGAERGYAGPE